MNSLGDQQENVENDMNFFKVLSENLKYTFNSPVPTTTQFPTPYSSNQLQVPSSAHHLRNPDSSFIEKSITANQQPQSFQQQQVPVQQQQLNLNGDKPLEDMDLQPSTVLQFGNNFPSEFLLPSPEQLKEFLLDSPAGFNLFHNTPAKTPLRFVTDSSDQQVTSSNLIHLFNSANGISNDGFIQESSNNSRNGNTNHDQQNNRTPLKKIDINLMFNAPNSASPSKKLSMSLTPYGRRVLNDMGTPYAKKIGSSNSALVDFQKARKDITQRSPDLRFRKVNKTPQQKNRIKNIQKNKKYSKMNKSNDENNDDRFNEKENFNDDLHEDEDEDIYGSSPTTIQLNSSVSKSVSRLDSNKIPNLTRNLNLIDEQLYERMPLSPTPKCPSNSRKPSMASQSMGLLQVPELPKMGSFKSERSLSMSSQPIDSLISASQSTKVPSISSLSSASNSSMSLSSATSTLALQTNKSRKGKIKKTKTKEPKFQVFVSSIHKFSDPNSAVPLQNKSIKKHKKQRNNNNNKQ